jgi:hypothetical protein
MRDDLLDLQAGAIRWRGSDARFISSVEADITLQEALMFAELGLLARLGIDDSIDNVVGLLFGIYCVPCVKVAR